MDHPNNNVSELVAHGHTYNNTTADGHAVVIQGDVHINDRELSEDAKHEFQRRGMYLEYAGFDSELDVLQP